MGGVADVRVECVHDDPSVGKLAGDPLEDLEAMSAGHLVVEDDHIRHELLARADGLLGVARHADALHVALGVDEIAEVLADRRMIVDREDSDRSPKHRSGQSRAAEPARPCRFWIDTTGAAA